MPVNDLGLTDTELAKIKRQRKAARKLAKAVRAKGIVITKRVDPDGCKQPCCKNRSDDYETTTLSDHPDLLKKLNTLHKTAEAEIEARRVAREADEPLPAWTVPASVVFEATTQVGRDLNLDWLTVGSSGRNEKGTFSSPQDPGFRHLSDEEKAELTKTQVAEARALEARIKLFNTVNELGLETLEPVLKDAGLTSPTWDEIYDEDSKLFL